MRSLGGSVRFAQDRWPITMREQKHRVTWFPIEYLFSSGNGCNSAYTLRLSSSARLRLCRLMPVTAAGARQASSMALWGCNRGRPRPLSALLGSRDAGWHGRRSPLLLALWLSGRRFYVLAFAGERGQPRRARTRRPAEPGGRARRRGWRRRAGCSRRRRSLPAAEPGVRRRGRGIRSGDGSSAPAAPPGRAGGCAAAQAQRAGELGEVELRVHDHRGRFQVDQAACEQHQLTRENDPVTRSQREFGQQEAGDREVSGTPAATTPRRCQRRRRGSRMDRRRGRILTSAGAGRSTAS